MLTLITPVLHSHPYLEKTIQDFNSQKSIETVRFVIVGNPKDNDLVRLEKQHPNFKIIDAPKGVRGATLAKGAEQVSDGWMLFLHVDTYLQGNWQNEISNFLTEQNEISKAGYFRFKQDGGGWKAYLLEKLVGFRNIFLALPYGDQGLLIHKSLYDQLGGFRADYPLMEDVDFVLKLGRKRLKRFSSQAVTSNERYKHGYIKRIVTNAKCLSLYFRGKDPYEIAKIYMKKN